MDIETLLYGFPFSRYSSGNFWLQFRILMSRSLASNARDRIVVQMRALQTVFIALVFGSIFFR